jgi:hypothetical protein
MLRTWPRVIVFVVLTAAGAAPALADGRAAKAAILRTVDESISGDQIAARPFEYVGKRVDLYCVVVGATYADFFDAACPKASLVIDAPGYSRAIKPGQGVRVLGVVERPWGSTSSIDEQVFPAVSVRILETWDARARQR